MTLVSFFDKLNKFTLYLLSLLIPIFFLPFTSNVLDFPKEILASILISLSLIGWLGQQICRGKLVFSGNKTIYFSLFLIFLSLFFSSLFSLWPRISFLGYAVDISDNFLTFFLFLILVFLLINSFKNETEFLFLFIFFIFSAAIAGIFNLFQIYKIFLFPLDFSKTSSFNTIGTPNGFALFGAVLLPIALTLTFLSKNYLRIILGLISLILFGNILLINFKTAWLSLIIGILILFIFGFGKEKKIKISFGIFLMLGLALSIFFYFFPFPLPWFPTLPPEIFLSFSSELYIIKETFSQGIKNMILGTGPGTFIFDYSKYRSPLMNQTLFWGTRFPNGNSVVLDWLLTKGLFGVTSLLLFYFLITYFVFKYLGKGEKFFEIKIAISAGILGLIFSSFLYPFNFMFYFTLAFLAGGLFFFFDLKLIEIPLSTPSRAILINAILIFSVIFTLSLSFLKGQKYFAEVKYLKGINASQAGNLDKAIEYLEKAIELDPSSDIYRRDLSQLYLAEANFVLQDPNLSPERKRQLANFLTVRGGEEINKTIEIAPMNVANWNVRGFFYRNLIGIEGAGEISLTSYQRAVELEPASPYSYGEKGRVHILMAQDFVQKGDKESQKKHLDLSLENLKKAIDLKSDYAPAHYLLAVVYDQQGKLDEAISKLKETQAITPQDFGIAFQLGLLYWRKEEIKEAREQFEMAADLNPNYSNTLYMLGLVYDKEGEKEKAKKAFENILELNPQDQTIKKILENLEKGLPALEGVILPQPPIQETPFEIKQ